VLAAIFDVTAGDTIKPTSIKNKPKKRTYHISRLCKYIIVSCVAHFSIIQSIFRTHFTCGVLGKSEH